jgi:hypothetical protein
MPDLAVVGVVTLADRTRSLIVVTALTLLVNPTVARAHAGNSDPNVLHVCIGNVSKVVRSVGVGGACVSAPPLLAETPGHWATQGPAGPKGDKGDQGLQGMQGLPGNPGTNGTNGTSVMIAGALLPGDTHCPTGGVSLTDGIGTFHLCNGADGTAGMRADGPCFDYSNRYVDCGNGTVTDTVTGLIWLKQWDCLPDNTWAEANQAAAGLKEGDCSLTDNSSAGDWRLPTSDEWRATLAPAFVLGCYFAGASAPPSLTNDAGTACYGSGADSSFAGMASGVYWSSTTDGTLPNFAWGANLYEGNVINVIKGYPLVRVWPVRGGGALD